MSFLTCLYVWCTPPPAFSQENGMGLLSMHDWNSYTFHFFLNQYLFDAKVSEFHYVRAKIDIQI